MTVDIVTFGCRLNIAESEMIRQATLKAKLHESSQKLVIFNSCAVTEEAVKQVKRAIRTTKRNKPDARIIVTGCAAQIAPADFSQMPEIDLVLGNDDKLHAHSYHTLPDFGLEQTEKIRVNDIMSVQENAPHMVDLISGKTRAFVQIQNGCDHRCTFCIIPYGRGRSRSVPAGAVVDQIKTLYDHGYQEVVLTGVDLTSYGPDLPGTMTLGKLVRSILHHVPHLPRLRLSSIDSIEIDEELFELLAYEKRLMPYLHLSLQAGDDIILKRMKRRHNRAHILHFCSRLRSKRPEIIFGADLIAGFPTETEAMFANSYSLIRECGLTHLHVFPFSPRNHTPAARMPQIAPALIKERAALLRQEGNSMLDQHLKKLQNTTQMILVEQKGVGRCEDYSLAEIADEQAGSLVPSRIIGTNQNRLIAVRHPSPIETSAITDMPLS